MKTQTESLYTFPSRCEVKRYLDQQHPIKMTKSRRSNLANQLAGRAVTHPELETILRALYNDLFTNQFDFEKILFTVTRIAGQIFEESDDDEYSSSEVLSRSEFANVPMRSVIEHDHGGVDLTGVLNCNVVKNEEESSNIGRSSLPSADDDLNLSGSSSTFEGSATGSYSFSDDDEELSVSETAEYWKEYLYVLDDSDTESKASDFDSMDVNYSDCSNADYGSDSATIPDDLTSQYQFSSFREIKNHLDQLALPRSIKQRKFLIAQKLCDSLLSEKELEDLIEHYNGKPFQPVHQLHDIVESLLRVADPC